MNTLFRNIAIGLLALGGSSLSTSAQELNCNVEINANQIEGTNTEIFSTLQDAINDYLNTTKFSNAQFSPNEKIECRFFLTISKYADGKMSGDIQVQATRPVYNSSYTTTLLNFKDTNVEFEYQEYEPLVFSTNNMESQLTAILNFYAYLILALDFDSFSPMGGNPYYERLATIVQLAQSSGESGWKAFEDTKNRSAILSAYTDRNTSAIRQLLYDYHRKGLDEMSVSPDKGRATITRTLLENLKQVWEAAPMSVALSMFRDAKLDELVNIYSKCTDTERKEIYDLLTSMYPTEQNRLIKIKEPPQTR